MKNCSFFLLLFLIFKFFSPVPVYSANVGAGSVKQENAVAVNLKELSISYTVTFTVYNGSIPLEGAYVTCNGEALQTDSNGYVAFTLVPEGDLPFLVNAPGFVDFTDERYITDNVDIPIHMNKYQSVQFKITDGLNPIQGAQVLFNSDTATADVDGIAQFGKIFPGNSSYTFTIIASGYADSVLNLSLANSDTILDPIALFKAYEIIINVTDSSNIPIEGAKITINPEVILTDTGGKAVFTKKLNGNYSFTVSKEEFVDFSGNIIVNNANAASTIKLSQGFSLIFTITNGPSDTIPLPGDTVTVNGVTKLTDENGVVAFGLFPGTYPVNVHKWGFSGTSFSVDITDKDTSEIIHLIPVYSVEFNVADALTYAPIEGASVKFNGITKLTDASGNVGFEGLNPSDSGLIFLASAGNGYLNDTGFVSLPFSSMAVSDNNVIYESVYLIRPSIGIILAEGLVTYFGAAIIQVDGEDYIYDTGLGMSFIAADTGLHHYTVIPADINKAIISGTFKVDNIGSDILIVQMINAFKVSIFTVDSSSLPIEGARVIFDNDTTLTDVTGAAVFSRKPANPYYYSISKDEYDSIPEALLFVDTTDVVVSVILNRNSYSVTFIVNDDSGPVQDAAVTLSGNMKGKILSEGDSSGKLPPAGSSMGGITKYTDADGKAIFTGIKPGIYTFVAGKAGYIDSSGSITVTDADIVKSIQIIATSIKNNIEPGLLPYPNPVKTEVSMNIPAEMTHVVISVISGNGGRISRTSYENSQGTKISVDMHALPAGIYFIELTSESGRRTWAVSKN